MFTLSTRTTVKGIYQEADDEFDLPFDEITPDISEADIVNSQGKPLYPSLASHMFMNYEVLLPHSLRIFWDAVLALTITRDMKWHIGF